MTNNPIVVETKSTIIKTDLLHKCKLYNKLNKTKIRAKHLGFTTQEENPVFICEQLTPRASRLHFLARDLVKSTAFTFCWTAYGNVYVRKDENSQIISITNEAQIKQLYHTAWLAIVRNYKSLYINTPSINLYVLPVLHYNIHIYIIHTHTHPLIHPHIIIQLHTHNSLSYCKFYYFVTFYFISLDNKTIYALCTYKPNPACYQIQLRKLYTWWTTSQT